jgi:hypothetical protein
MIPDVRAYLESRLHQLSSVDDGSIARAAEIRALRGWLGLAPSNAEVDAIEHKHGFVGVHHFATPHCLTCGNPEAHPSHTIGPLCACGGAVARIGPNRVCTSCRAFQPPIGPGGGASG